MERLQKQITWVAGILDSMGIYGTILLLGVGILVFVHNWQQMTAPSTEATLVSEMVTKDLPSLGPWTKHGLFTKRQVQPADNSQSVQKQGSYLCLEQSLSLMSTILKFRLRTERTITSRCINERLNLFKKQLWPSWELEVEATDETMSQSINDLTAQALKFVGIEQQHWQACVDHYFKYPQGFQQVKDAYTKLISDYRESLPPTTFPDKSLTLTAWRWLLLKEAELEHNMEQILFKNDLDMYHRVKCLEMAKIEDGLSDEFGIGVADLMWKSQTFGADEHTDQFLAKLRDMLEEGDKIFLGMDTRLDLWKAVDSLPVILTQDKAGTTILSLPTLLSLLNSISGCLKERHQRCLQSFITYRHHLFTELETDPQRMADYKSIVKQITTAEVKLREEALSFVLGRIRVGYKTFKLSLKHFMESEAKQQILKLWLGMFESDPKEFDVIERDVVIEVAKRIAAVTKRVCDEIKDDQDRQQEELSLQQSMEYDRLFAEKQIDERTFEFNLQRSLRSDPKLRELYSKFDQ